MHKTVMTCYLLSIALSVANADENLPNPFVDKGACPFEGCAYREWTVDKDTPIYDKIDGTKLVGTAVKGTRATALTGEVHTVPGKVAITTNHGKYHPGDVIYVLTYEGEGIFKIWFNGKISSDGDVYQILDENGQKGKGPNAKKNSWAKLERQPQSMWWAQIKLKDGKIGWTKETKNFGTQDALGD